MKNIGISRKRLVGTFEGLFKTSKSTEVNGKPRHIGTTKDRLASIETIGSRKDISQATLTIGIPRDNPVILQRNIDLLTIFVGTILPGWDDRNVWIQRVLDSSNPSASVVVGDKIITMQAHPEKGMISATIKAIPSKGDKTV